MSIPSSRPARGSYAKSERFRVEVLDAALALVAEHGFDATTLQAIAESVQRSKAGILHHFGSRENLMLEIVRHRDRTDRRLFPGAEEDSFQGSFDLAEHNATVPGLVALFTVVSALAASDSGPTERRSYFVDRYARTRQGFAARIARAQESGAFRDDIAPDQAAGLMLAAMDGLQTQWLLDPTIDMSTHLRTLTRMFTPADHGDRDS